MKLPMKVKIYNNRTEKDTGNIHIDKPELEAHELNKIQDLIQEYILKLGREGKLFPGNYSYRSTIEVAAKIEIEFSTVDRPIVKTSRIRIRGREDGKENKTA